MSSSQYHYNSGSLMPTTLVSGLAGAMTSIRTPINTLNLATRRRRGNRRPSAPYYRPTPSPQPLAATSNPQQAYAQAQLDAGRLRASGINTDFAPLADVYQGGAVSQSRCLARLPIK